MLFVCAMVLCNISFSQIEIEKYGEFKLAAHDHPMALFSNISAVSPSGGDAGFLVQVDGGAGVTEFYYPNRGEFNDFVEGIEATIPIYEQWSEICAKNSIRHLMKKLPIKIIKPYVVFVVDGSLYSITSAINPMFYVDAEGKCFVVLETVMVARKSWSDWDLRLFGYDVPNKKSNYEIVKSTDSKLVFSSTKDFVDSRCRLVFSSSEEIKNFAKQIRGMLRLSDENAAMSKLLTK